MYEKTLSCEAGYSKNQSPWESTPMLSSLRATNVLTGLCGGIPLLPLLISSLFLIYTSVSNPPEVQMEPHVCYYKPYPFITVAEDIESMDEVFYEIYSHEVGWVQVSWILGNEIRNKIKNAGF